MLGYLVFRNPLHTSNMLEGCPFFLLLGVSIYSYLPIEEKKRTRQVGISHCNYYYMFPKKMGKVQLRKDEKNITEDMDSVCW